MADIRYLCISDLHLGADTSLLTCLRPGTSEVDPSQPSVVLRQLADCLHSLVAVNGDRRKPTLILNGDVLELALALDNQAVMAFERFLELLFPANREPLVDSQIIFIPGNHDHHLWETARETQYAQFLKRKPPGSFLEPPWHATKMFQPDLVAAGLLDAVVGRYPRLKEMGVHIGAAYPNLVLLNRDDTRCAIFTHGHFIEAIYELMSQLRTSLFPDSGEPEQVWELEAENFAWIDFFWSTLGRSSEVGTDVERIYEMLLVPRTRRTLAAQLARAIGRKLLPRIPNLGSQLGLILAPIIYSFLQKAGGLEKRRAGELLTGEASRGLRNYVEGPLRSQFLLERNRTMPVQAALVFGHTHKPFASTRNFRGFPQQVALYNTGGWVVDTPDTDPTHGASIAVLDDDWNLVALRVYNEAGDPHGYPVKVECANGNCAANPLYAQLETVLKRSEQQWRSLSALIADQVSTYHQNVASRLKRLSQPV